MNLEHAKQAIVDFYGSGAVLHLRSKPGVGKTAVVKQAIPLLEEKYGEPFALYTHHLSTLDSVDTVGFMMPGKVEHEGRTYDVSTFTRSPLLPPLDAPSRCVIFLDELYQASHDVLKPCARFLHEGKIGVHSIDQSKVMIVAASNRSQDRSGVTKTLAFFQNRLTEIEIEPHLGTWVDWAEANRVHPLIIAFAKFKPGVIFGEDVPTVDGPFCTPRSIVEGAAVTLSRIDDMTLATEIMCGQVGEGAAAEIMAFVRVAAELPTFDQIVKHPDTTPVPERMDACFAATQMLAMRVNEKTIKPVFKYMNRLPPEFQISGFRTALSRNKGIITDPDFSEWCITNAQFVLAAHATT